MAFQVAEVSLELVTSLQPLLRKIQKENKSLAEQLNRAVSSIALNIAESQYSDPGNRRARLFTAAGSANETRMALQVALAWGYVSGEEASGAAALLDRTLAMLWRLTHPRGR